MADIEVNERSTSRRSTRSTALKWGKLGRELRALTDIPIREAQFTVLVEVKGRQINVGHEVGVVHEYQLVAPVFPGQYRRPATRAYHSYSLLTWPFLHSDRSRWMPTAGWIGKMYAWRPTSFQHHRGDRHFALSTRQTRRKGDFLADAGRWARQAASR